MCAAILSVVGAGRAGACLSHGAFPLVLASFLASAFPLLWDSEVSLQNTHSNFSRGDSPGANVTDVFE